MDATTALIFQAGPPTTLALVGIAIDIRAMVKLRRETERWRAESERKTIAMMDEARRIRATLGAS
jgi:hypothetical protein